MVERSTLRDMTIIWKEREVGINIIQGFFVLVNEGQGFMVWEGRKSKAHNVDFLF